MDISFAHKELERLCNDTRYATKKLGSKNAERLLERLDDLLDADCLDRFRALSGRCHELKGKLKGCLALDLHGGWRLVFEPDHEPTPTKADGGLDWREVTKIRIVSIEDYHD